MSENDNAEMLEPTEHQVDAQEVEAKSQKITYSNICLRVSDDEKDLLESTFAQSEKNTFSTFTHDAIFSQLKPTYTYGVISLESEDEKK